MKKVMVRAWEIAREGAKKFGGKVIEYLAEALRMAWAEVKMIAKDEKGSIQLKGTEKQVKWAKAIREQYMKAFDEFYVMFQESKYGKKVENIEEAKKDIYEAVFNQTDSKYYIEKMRFIGESLYTEQAMCDFLNEQLKELIEERHIGAIKFRNFFGSSKVNAVMLSDIIKKHKVNWS